MKLTDVLDGLGIICLAVFAYFVWPPLPFAVVGAVLLFVSWTRTRGGKQ